MKREHITQLIQTLEAASVGAFDHFVDVNKMIEPGMALKDTNVGIQKRGK